MSIRQRPSQQMRAIPHEVMSATMDQVVVLLSGSQCWHSLAGLRSPALRHVPAMRQRPGWRVLAHAPVAGLHESVVHARRSSQASPLVAPLQTPPKQRSEVVQASPSLQTLVLFVNMHPDAPHVSVVPGLPSLQVTTAVAHRIVATLQLSVVHALPSSH